MQTLQNILLYAIVLIVIAAFVADHYTTTQKMVIDVYYMMLVIYNTYTKYKTFTTPSQEQKLKLKSNLKPPYSEAFSNLLSNNPQSNSILLKQSALL